VTAPATPAPPGRPPPRPPVPRRPGRAARRLVVLLVLPGLLGALVAGRTAQVALTTPATAADVAAQVRYLRSELAGGAAGRAQEQFPEGFFFLHVLTGLAAAAQGPPAADTVAAELAALDSPAGRAPFPPDAAPAYGAFWTGWSLLLAVELARLRPGPGPAAAVRERAAPLVAALAGSPTGFLESYPGQRWPVDTVVAVAALARADRLVGVPGAAAVVRAWPARADRARDAATGLLPHRFVADPSSVAAGEPPRGTSSVLAALFEPDVDAAAGARDYAAVVRHFVTRRLGWVAVAEYPDGAGGPGDVDSGPLVLGVSFSASVVAIGAARRAGDVALARDLEREGELFGLPWEWQGRRRYALGVLPVGDAFVAFARSVPAGVPGDPGGDAPAPLWWLWVATLLLPGAGALLAAWRAHDARRPRPTGDHRQGEGGPGGPGGGGAGEGGPGQRAAVPST